jgi:acyl-CoA synthetase (AMP-forming)/AMP-acid ligase II/thioesterase domain-containing protein/acyl carrier protein
MPISTMCELLGHQAERQAGAAAILSPERRSMTYGELNGYAHKISAQLRSHGVGRDDRIAVVLPNGPEMALAFIASAFAGTCAPLNPQYTAAEYEFYLSDLKAKVLLLNRGDHSPAAAVARKLGIPVLEISALVDEPAGAFSLSDSVVSSALPGDDNRKGHDCALVLHTSGTTSRPKLVPLTHANVCESAANIKASLGLGPADRVLNVMPLFHIHGLIGALISSLAAGGSVICAPGFNEEKFFGWMEDLQPTWYTAVPTMHQAILKRAADNCHIITAHPLRLIRSCSASLPPQLMADLEKAFNTPVVEAYGMTEACHQISINPLPPLARKPKSVGLPSGVQAAIMDDKGGFLPTGAVGEIVIKGKNVTLGYDNNPAANAESFVDGWFRTGDQGYLDPDGYLFITGRIKEIINRGGEKIAPREVDEVFLEHPQVAQAIAFATPHPTLGQDVAVAVVPKNKAPLNEEDLREFAFDRLAAFKVPSKVVVVESIPKGPTGKLQRIGLYQKLSASLSPAFVAPRTATEKTMAVIWEGLLNLQRVGVHDNFFQLGGDSISAVRLVVEIGSRLGLKVDPASVFRHPTVEQLSRLVVRQDAQRAARSLVKVSRGSGGIRLFSIPGTMGNVFADLGHLATYLEPEHRLCAFQDGIHNPQNINRLAAEYLREMVGADAEGPYFLLGICSGAVVAFEMAQQLNSMGRKVAFLGMVEPSPPRTNIVRSYLEFLCLVLRRASSQPSRHSSSMIRLTRAERDLYLKIRLRFYIIHLAARHYQPKTYPGSLYLYGTDESFDGRRNPIMRWARYSQKSPRVRRIPGTHASITGKFGTSVSEIGMRGLAARVRTDIEPLGTKAIPA